MAKKDLELGKKVGKIPKGLEGMFSLQNLRDLILPEQEIARLKVGVNIGRTAGYALGLMHGYFPRDKSDLTPLDEIYLLAVQKMKDVDAAIAENLVTAYNVRQKEFGRKRKIIAIPTKTSYGII